MEDQKVNGRNWMGNCSKDRKGSPNENDDEIERHDFQRVKLESFKKGKFRKAFLSVGLAS